MLGIILILSAILGAVLVACFIIFLRDFAGNVRHIKMEIRRSDGNEGDRIHWQRELYALYISLIPGVSFGTARKIARKLFHK